MLTKTLRRFLQPERVELHERLLRPEQAAHVTREARDELRRRRKRDRQNRKAGRRNP